MNMSSNIEVQAKERLFYYSGKDRLAHLGRLIVVFLPSYFFWRLFQQGISWALIGALLLAIPIFYLLLGIFTNYCFLKTDGTGLKIREFIRQADVPWHLIEKVDVKRVSHKDRLFLTPFIRLEIYLKKPYRRKMRFLIKGNFGEDRYQLAARMNAIAKAST